MKNINNQQPIIARYPLEIILIILFVLLSIFAQGFFTVENQLNIVRNVAMQGIVAFGMTMVIISGEIDLSVGSMMAAAGCITAWIVDQLTWSLGINPIIGVPIAIASAVAFGVCTGLLVGFIRYRFNVATFITTLGLLLVLFGIASLVTGGFPIAPFPEWYGFIGSGRILGIPFPAIVFLVVFAIIFFIMEYTTLGRSIYAVGGNMHAARVSGINVWKVKATALAITSGLAALSGVLISSQIMSGNAGTARGLEMDIIASVIIGGAALSGGIGRIWGTFVGVLFVGVILNGMILLNIGEYWQYVVRGGLIIGAVLLNQVQSGLAKANR